MTPFLDGVGSNPIILDGSYMPDYLISGSEQKTRKYVMIVPK